MKQPKVKAFVIEEPVETGNDPRTGVIVRRSILVPGNQDLKREDLIIGIAEGEVVPKRSTNKKKTSGKRFEPIREIISVSRREYGLTRAAVIKTIWIDHDFVSVANIFFELKKSFTAMVVRATALVE